MLFENAGGLSRNPLGVRLLWNILGPSLKRTALSLEEPPDTPTVELIRRVKEKFKTRIAPREVPRSEAPIYEHTITGDDIDLGLLPIPRHWPLDGGHYAGTADAVITRDPDNGSLNVGTYRMMVQGKSQAGLYLSPGKDALLHITRAWQKDEPIQVAAAWGIDPLFMLVGSQKFPKDVSEFEYAGGVKGEPVAVVRGTMTDLLLPANAEIVVEGIIPPRSVKAEGPFGEFTGVLRQARGASAPGGDHRAALPGQPGAHQRAHGGLSLVRAERVLRRASCRADLGRSREAWRAKHPRCLFASGGGGRVRHDGRQPRAALSRPRRAGAGARRSGPRGAYFTKWVIAVDEDVDPTDMDQVIWAMATRSNPVDDIDFLRNTGAPRWIPPRTRPTSGSMDRRR